jgi:hypothetical protein
MFVNLSGTAVPLQIYTNTGDALRLKLLDHIQLDTYSLQDSSGRVIRSSQRSLPAQQAQQTHIQAHSGVLTRDLANQAATDLSLRPHGRWNQLYLKEQGKYYISAPLN